MSTQICRYGHKHPSIVVTTMLRCLRHILLKASKMHYIEIAHRNPVKTDTLQPD